MNGTPYEALTDLAKRLGYNMEDIIAMSAASDPFYMGQPFQRREAEWFARVWHGLGYGEMAGIHLRRVHYRLSGDTRRYDEAWVMPETKKDPAEPYENTFHCFERLIRASIAARHLGLVDAHAFVDRRSPEPHIYLHGDGALHPTVEVEWEGWLLPSAPTFALDADIELPTASVSGYRYREDLEPYHLEIWIEKSTMDDVLKPLCSDYGVNLVTGVGYMSISSAMRLMRDARRWGKPVRILYASDFDPAGIGMPITPSRQIEYALWKMGGNSAGIDIRLEPVILSKEQVEYYELPPVPLKDEASNTANFVKRHGATHGAELDALEAEHPGELRRLREEQIIEFRDAELPGKLREAAEEAQELADAELERRLAPHAGEIEAIRVEAEEIAERYRPRLEAIGQELDAEMSHLRERLIALRQVAEEAVGDLNGIELPEVEPDLGTPNDDEWLFDSSRSYLEQLDYYKTHQGRSLENVREKSCAMCGESFIASKKDAMYCSQKCNHKAYRQRERAKKKAERVTYEKNCDACGAACTAKRSTTTFCSDKCRAKLSRARKRAEQR